MGSGGGGGGGVEALVTITGSGGGCKVAGGEEAEDTVVDFLRRGVALTSLGESVLEDFFDFREKSLSIIVPWEQEKGEEGV